MFLAASRRNVYVISVICILGCVCREIPKKGIKEIIFNGSYVGEGNVIPCTTIFDCSFKDANMICNSFHECVCAFTEKMQDSVCSDASIQVATRCKYLIDCPLLSNMECNNGTCACKPNKYNIQYLPNNRMRCVEKPEPPKECYKDSECYNKDPGKYCNSYGSCICRDLSYINSLGSYTKTDCPRDSSSGSSRTKSELTDGEKVGIGLGVLAFVVIIVVLELVRVQRKKSRLQASTQIIGTRPERDVPWHPTYGSPSLNTSRGLTATIHAPSSTTNEPTYPDTKPPDYADVVGCPPNMAPSAPAPPSYYAVVGDGLPSEVNEQSNYDKHALK